MTEGKKLWGVRDTLFLFLRARSFVECRLHLKMSKAQTLQCRHQFRLNITCGGDLTIHLDTISPMGMDFWLVYQIYLLKYSSTAGFYEHTVRHRPILSYSTSVLSSRCSSLCCYPYKTTFPQMTGFIRLLHQVWKLHNTT